MVRYQGAELPKPTSRRKQTRRWCRGKVGVEHQTARAFWFEHDCLPGREGTYYKYICQVCGRMVRVEFVPKSA